MSRASQPALSLRRSSREVTCHQTVPSLTIQNRSPSSIKMSSEILPIPPATSQFPCSTRASVPMRSIDLEVPSRQLKPSQAVSFSNFTASKHYQLSKVQHPLQIQKRESFESQALDPSSQSSFHYGQKSGQRLKTLGASVRESLSVPRNREFWRERRRNTSMPHVLISSQDVVLEEDADKENIISPSNFSDKLLEVGDGLRIKTQKKGDDFAPCESLNETKTPAQIDITIEQTNNSPEATVNDLFTLQQKMKFLEAELRQSKLQKPLGRQSFSQRENLLLDSSRSRQKKTGLTQKQKMATSAILPGQISAKASQTFRYQQKNQQQLYLK